MGPTRSAGVGAAGLPKPGKKGAVTILSYRKSTPLGPAKAKAAEIARTKLVEQLPQLRRKYWKKMENEGGDNSKVEAEVEEMEEAPVAAPALSDMSTILVQPQATRRSGRVPKRKRFSGEEEEEQDKPPPTLKAEGSVALRVDQQMNDPYKTPTKLTKKVDTPSSVTSVETMVIGYDKAGSSAGAIKSEELITPQFFLGKKQFVSAIMVIMDAALADVDYEKLEPESAWLHCGICKSLEEINNFSLHKKYGCFICKDCNTFLQKMIRISKKAQALDCLGQGSCDITASKEEKEHCEACFVRNCLLTLNIPDDLYFKLYRSIPPMAKNSLSAVPVLDGSLSNKGKVVFVNRANGRILHATTTNYKTVGRKVTINNPSKKENDATKSKPITAEDTVLDSTTFRQQGPRVLLPNEHDSLPRRGARVKQVVRHNAAVDGLPRATFRDAIETEAINKTETDKVNSEEENEPEKAVKVFPALESTEVLEEHGYPVVVNSTLGEESPKPLCYSCGSAGINQLVFCGACCQPFHPYCSEDELLLSTYLSHSLCSPDARLPIETLAKKFRKWKCHRCVCCRQCGRGSGGCGKEEEFVGCSLCYSSFHLKCTKKMPLRPTGERDKWVCGSCLQCTSCGVPLTKSSHHLRKFCITEGDSASQQPDILCLECFRRRQKGSFCPVCLSCYDDDDWDSKMMECDKCQRWIHAQCEDLNEEKYFILSSLPESIPYVCRLCMEPCNVGWRLAVERELEDGCFKILDLFHKKAVGMSRKRRALSFEVEQESGAVVVGEICEVTTPKEHNNTPSNFTPSVLVPNLSHQYLSPVKRASTEEEALKKSGISLSSSTTSTSCLEDLIKQYNIQPCSVRLVDMDKPELPKAVEQVTPKKQVLPPNPITNTPTKMSTPNRVVTSFTEAVRSTSTLWACVRDFRNISLKLLPTYFEEMTCAAEKYEGEDKFLQYFEDTVKQVFPWWRDDLKVQVLKKRDLNDNEEDSSDDTTGVLEELEETPKITVKEEHDYPDSIAFQDVHWDEHQWMDYRPCALCGETGDFPLDSVGRLLYVNPEEWVHVNCAIWSSEVWEDQEGCLQQVEAALFRGKKSECTHCSLVGATLNCCAGVCQRRFHFLCAVDAACVLQTDKSVFCSFHSNSAKGQEQRGMHVTRKVFVGGNANPKRKDLRLPSNKLTLFVGSTRVDALGRLVPISVIDSSLTSSGKLLLPVNFQIGFLRLQSPTFEVPDRKYTFLSWKTFLNKSGDFRSQSDIDVPPTSNFSVVIDHSKHHSLVAMRLRDAQEFWKWEQTTSKFVDEFNVEWTPIYKPPSRKKKKQSFTLVQSKTQLLHRASIEWKPVHPVEEVSREVFEMGLSHPRLRFLLEQLPGVEFVGDSYKFQHCLPSTLPKDTPVTPTPTGCCRSEAFSSRKPLDMFGWLKSKHRKPPSYSAMVVSEENMKSKGLPIAMRFRNLKERATKDLMVLPSHIHGRGLFASRDMEMGEMLIEYAGELIRSALCDVRERKYELAGIGCYMFRVNRDLVVDATMKGNAARFINHSCDPNCESKAVKILGKDHILIFALRSIGRGEEFTYDYKFERETDKLPCSCGTRRCRRFLN